MAWHATRIHLHYRPGENLPGSECLWGTPLGGDRYRLITTSDYVPLLAEDVVTTRPRPDGELMVAGIVEPDGLRPHCIVTDIEPVPRRSPAARLAEVIATAGGSYVRLARSTRTRHRDPARRTSV